jgi:hypothetical protein
MRVWKFLVLLVCWLLVSCGEAPDVSMGQVTSRADPFGVIDRGAVKQWSALWHMSQNGSIAFCIRNARNQSDTQRVQGAARRAVNGWLQRLTGNRPDYSFPEWTRSSIQISFNCSSGAYTIALFTGRSNCEYDRKKVNLNYSFQTNEFTHEFGHSMGLADTYNYQGGIIQGQPSSMMQNIQWSSDDWYGIWALWKWLVTGTYSCGPGYVSADNGNYPWDLMCRPTGDTGGTGGVGGTGGTGGTGGGGGGGDCQYRCADYGYQEGQCYQGWECQNGCIRYVGTCGPSCQYRCADYGYREGQCYQNWLCQNGCLIRRRCRDN